MENKVCCFIGHRKIDKTPKLRENLLNIIEDLIVNKSVSTFMFGSKSKFDDYCYELVTELKTKYSHIKRIYVRSAYEHIPDWYENSLLEHYEDTYFPEHMSNAGRASYVERNQEMINKATSASSIMMKTIFPQEEKKAEEIYLINNLKVEPGLNMNMLARNKQLYLTFLLIFLKHNCFGKVYNLLTYNLPQIRWSNFYKNIDDSTFF